jgi:uncharacterized protein (DUF2252 family)
MSDETQQRCTAGRGELRQQGKARRAGVPRSSHGKWAPAPDRLDPVSVLQAQDQSRVPQLVPIKYGRMLASPFAFLRGSAIVMAGDLAATPASGLHAQLCGDAHLLNFGLFASPERELLFDINDFDETYPGPWEWDLKRLAASVVVAGRENGFSDEVCRDLAIDVSSVYCAAIKRFSGMRTMEIWYFHVEADALQTVFAKTSSEAGQKQTEKAVRKARGRTQEQSLAKLTETVEGRRRIRNDPPLLVRLKEIVSRLDLDPALAIASIDDAWAQYLGSLAADRRQLLSRFEIAA